MKTVLLHKERKLSESEQTIADIRKFRFEESKKIKTFEDLEKYEEDVDKEMHLLRQKFKKSH